MQGASRNGSATYYFFNLKDPDNFPGRIEDEDLEIFQDKLRIAAAKYLEIQLANEEVANEG